MRPSRDRVRLLLFVSSIILFGYSLSLPALLFAHHRPLSGLTILAWGWWGILTLQYAWFANPTYAFALFWYGRQERLNTAFLSGLALLLGAAALGTKEWWFNEGGGTAIAGLGSGFVVWMSSFVCLLAAGVIPATPRTPPGRAPTSDP